MSGGYGRGPRQLTQEVRECPCALMRSDEQCGNGHCADSEDEGTARPSLEVRGQNAPHDLRSPHADPGNPVGQNLLENRRRFRQL